MNSIFRIVYISVSVLLIAAPTYAEGGKNRPSGDHGINRRVVTNADGYTGVQGIFESTVKNVQVPDIPSGSPDSPQYDDDLVPNLYRDKPTSYVGSFGSSIEIDAGLQYFPKGSYGGDLYPAGWGPFISRNGDLKTPKYCYSHHWYGYRGEINDADDENLTYNFQLIFTIDEDSGLAYIETSGNNEDTVLDQVKFPFSTNALPDPSGISDGKTFPLTSDGIRVYTANQMNTVSVKRVVGMTQGAPHGSTKAQSDAFTYELDGSVITCTYSAGQVKKKGGSWADWTPTIVNQTKNHTGYDVDENAKDAKWGGKDGKLTVKSQYILTFPKIEAYTYTNSKGQKFTIPATSKNPKQKTTREKARTNDWPTTLLTENKKSRYVEETVKISLRSATKVTGEKSTVRSKSK